MYLMRVCASHNQDLPCIQGVHPHPTPRMRHVFPVRRKRTRSSYAVQMGQTGPRGGRCSRGTNTPRGPRRPARRQSRRAPPEPEQRRRPRRPRGCGDAAARTKQTHRWPLGFAAQSGQRCDRADRPMAGYGYRGRSCFASGRCTRERLRLGGPADSGTRGPSAPPRTPRRCWRECARAH